MKIIIDTHIDTKRMVKRKFLELAKRPVHNNNYGARLIDAEAVLSTFLYSIKTIIWSVSHVLP